MLPLKPQDLSQIGMDITNKTPIMSRVGLTVMLVLSDGTFGAAFPARRQMTILSRIFVRSFLRLAIVANTLDTPASALNSPNAP